MRVGVKVLLSVALFLLGCAQVSEATMTQHSASTPTASVKALKAMPQCWDIQAREVRLCVPEGDPNVIPICPTWPMPTGSEPCAGGPAFTPGTAPPPIVMTPVTP